MRSLDFWRGVDRALSYLSIVISTQPEFLGGTGNEYRLFVMKPSKAFLRNSSGKWTQSSRDGQLMFTREVPYRGVVVLMGDTQELLGVSGFDEGEQAIALLETLVR